MLDTCSSLSRRGCLSLPLLWINQCHGRPKAHKEDCAENDRVQEGAGRGYIRRQWFDSRNWSARHRQESTNLYASGRHGAFDWTRWMVVFPIMEFLVEQGCRTSPGRQDRIAHGNPSLLTVATLVPRTLSVTVVQDINLSLGFWTRISLKL